MMKTRKKLIVTIMSLVMSLCAFFGITAITKTTASADAAFYVSDKASIKVDESGIRFYALMDETTKTQAETYGFGFFIFPQSYYTEVTDLDVTDFNGTLPKKQTITGDKTKIYSYGDGLYAVNAVLKDLQATSFDIEFTCVAYVLDENGGYTYAYDETLAKSVYNIASQAVLNTEEASAKIDGIFTTYGAESVYGFGTTTKPVLVTDGEQIYELDALVDGGRTYQDINFKATNDVTVDCNGLTAPISETFGGTFVESDSKIDLVNGGSDGMAHAFANCVDGTCTVCEKVESLLTVTSKTPIASFMQYDDNGKYPGKASYYANTELPVESENDALGIEVSSQYNLYITLNYTKTEIQAWADQYKYEAVELTYLFDDDDNERTYTGGLLAGSSVETDVWEVKRVAISDFLEHVSTGVDENGEANKLYLWKGWHKGGLTVYLADINLVVPTLFDADAQTSTTAKTAFAMHGTGGYAASTKASKVENADLPVTGYDGAALKLTVGNQYYMYAKLNYSKTQLEAMKEVYASAVINVLYQQSSGTMGTNKDSNGGIFNSSESTIRDTLSLETYGWMQLEFSLDTLISYMGTGGVNSGDTANSGITDNHLYLTKHYMKSTTYYLYLGDITLVPKA